MSLSFGFPVLSLILHPELIHRLATKAHGRRPYYQSLDQHSQRDGGYTDWPGTDLDYPNSILVSNSLCSPLMFYLIDFSYSFHLWASTTIYVAAMVRYFAVRAYLDAHFCRLPLAFPIMEVFRIWNNPCDGHFIFPILWVPRCW